MRSFALWSLAALAFVDAQTLPECTNATINVDKDFRQFVISSSSADVVPKNCHYTFNVDQYLKPTVFVANLLLSGNDLIQIRQFSPLGGKAITYAEAPKAQDDVFQLGPANFTIDFWLPARAANESFYIVISAVDVSPMSQRPWIVRADLAEIVDADELQQGVAVVMMALDQQKLSVRYIEFVPLADDYLDSVFVYDGNFYQGTLLELVQAQNASQLAVGQLPTFVNTNGVPANDSFALLCACKYDMPGTVELRKMSLSNTTETYSATNGAAVFHVLSSRPTGTQVPTSVLGIEFRGVGVLTAFAGCTVQATDARLIATINSTVANNFVPLTLHGRCRTFVLSQGLVNLLTFFGNNDDYDRVAGQQGVIMSDDYPLADTFNGSDPQSFYMQATGKKNINVMYEFVSFANSVTLSIRSKKRGQDETVETYSLSRIPPKTLTVGPSYQQHITYSVPKGSPGFLIRYTVTDASSGQPVMTAIAVWLSLYISLSAMSA